MAGPIVQNPTTGPRQPSRTSSTSPVKSFGRSLEKASGQQGGSKPAAGGNGGGDNGPSFMDVVHGGLDAAGLWPGVGIIPDLLNAGLYGIRGEGQNALWSLGSAIPAAGQAVTAAKWTKKGVDAAGLVRDGLRTGDRARDAGRALKAGAGGGNWPKSNVRHVGDDIVIRQADNASCGQACGAMVLRDRGVDVRPTDIGSGLSSFGVDVPNNLASQITKAAPNTKWATGHASDLEGAFKVLNRENGGSWIAELRERGSKVGHAVVVDGLDAAGNVKIRDPWDQTTYTMTRSDFIQNWTGGFVGQ